MREATAAFQSFFFDKCSKVSNSREKGQKQDKNIERKRNKE